MTSSTDVAAESAARNYGRELNLRVRGRMPPKCAAKTAAESLKPPVSAARDCHRELDLRARGRGSRQDRSSELKPPNANGLGTYESPAVATGTTARSPTSNNIIRSSREEGRGERGTTLSTSAYVGCTSDRSVQHCEYTYRVWAQGKCTSNQHVYYSSCASPLQRRGRGHRRRANLKHLWGSGE